MHSWTASARHLGRSTDVRPRRVAWSIALLMLPPSPPCRGQRARFIVVGHSLFRAMSALNLDPSCIVRCLKTWTGLVHSLIWRTGRRWACQIAPIVILLRYILATPRSANDGPLDARHVYPNTTPSADAPARVPLHTSPQSQNRRRAHRRIVSLGLGPVLRNATVHTVVPCFPPKVKLGWGTAELSSAESSNRGKARTSALLRR